jgi:1-acyl-sn-glycerol-3-phosphate acyltransferase
LRVSLGPWLLKKFNVHAENVEIVKGLRPPFVVVPNHTCVWDPFMVNSFVPGPIHYVVSDANFRSRVMDFGLSLVGSIPKTKVMSDLETVKNIMRVKERGGVIGIFPEGQNTWDGSTLPLYYSTAKLLKVLKAPVVTARVTGGFLSKPRWAKNSRRGKVTIRFEVAYTPQQLKKASPDEIHATLERHLANNDFDYNRTARIPFRGKDRAEWLERSLFICPSCERIGSLRSSGNRFACADCGYTVTYNRYGFFESREKCPVFDNMHDWNTWQVARLKEMLIKSRGSGSDTLLFAEPEVLVETGYKAHTLSTYARGRLELYPDRVVLVQSDGKRDSFYVEDIDGANVQNGERLEFYVGDALYRVTPSEKRGCTYKWALAIGELGQMPPEQAAVADA